MSEPRVYRDVWMPWGETLDFLVEKCQYADGSLALVLLDPHSGECLSKASVNLYGYGVTPDPGCAFIPDYSENTGMSKMLVEEGIVELTGRTVKFGWNNSCKAHEARLVAEGE